MKKIQHSISLWENLHQNLDSGIRIVTEHSFLSPSIHKGIFQLQEESFHAWFGETKNSPFCIMLISSGTVFRTELLVDLSKEEKEKITKYHRENGEFVEFLTPFSPKTCDFYALNKNRDIGTIYEAAFESTNQLIAVMDNELTLQYANNALLHYLDETIDEVIGTPYWELPLWSHSCELQNKVMFSMENLFLGETVKFETTHKTKDGSLRDIDFILKAAFNEQHEIDFILGMGYDVTELKLTESALKRTEKELKLFFDYSINGYFINRLQESVHLNPEQLDNIFLYIQQHEKLFNYNEALLEHMDISLEQLASENIFGLLQLEEQGKCVWKEMIQKGHSNLQAELEVQGKLKILDCTFVPIIENKHTYIGSFGIINDITEKTLIERKLVHLATKDPLTNANNRRHYLELATASMLALTKNNIHPSVLMLDIDDFKNVNDTYGHDVGDKVLIKMTNVCEALLSQKGFFGRMGGEEFSCYLYNKDDCGMKTAEQLRKAIQEIVIETELGQFSFTVSIGYTEVQEGHTMEEALKRADKALYRAKRAGKNQVVPLFLDQFPQ